MVFVFDIDDTICETDEYSTEYIKNFFIENNLPYKQIRETARFAEKKFDWDMNTAISWYRTFGDKMMYEFPCKKCAIELINSLFSNGHTIIIATARANDWHAEPEKVTLEWLAKNNIKYNKLYIGRVDKELICLDEKADYFVDDDIKITENVAKQNPNMHVFLAPTAYNSSLPIAENVIRINDISELYNYIN